MLARLSEAHGYESMRLDVATFDFCSNRWR